LKNGAHPRLILAEIKETTDAPERAAGERLSRGVFVIVALATLLAAAGLRLQSLGRPMESHWHQQGLFYSVAARNYLEHGVWETRFAMVLNGGPAAEPADFVIYVHHPPLVPLLLAAAFAVAKDELSALRILMTALSVASVALLIAVVARLFGRMQGLLAGLILAFCPMAAFYATNADVMSEGLSTFLLLGLAGRLVLRPRRPRLGRAVEYTAYALSALYDWAGFLSFGIPLLDALTRRLGRRALIEGGLAILASAALFALVFAWGRMWVARGPWEIEIGNVGTGAYWLIGGLVEDAHEFFDLAKKKAISYLIFQRRLWTVPILGAAALHVVVTALRLRPKPSVRRPALGLLLFAPRGGYLLLMAKQCFIHDFAAIMLAPFVAFAAARGVAWVARFGTAGRVAAALWCVAVVTIGTLETRSLFAATRVERPPEALEWLRKNTAPQDVVGVFHEHATQQGFYARRTFYGPCRTLDPHPQVIGYLERHRDARVFYFLPPIEEYLRTQPAPLRVPLRAALRRIEKELLSRFEHTPVAGHKIFDLTRPLPERPPSRPRRG
jgi:4-amino-4-deoxy-L-arabinose transferase-like glycosyltransferase